MTDTTPHSKAQQQFWVVVPAAGVGERMQADRPKQYLRLAGKTILEHTLSRLLEHPAVAGVVAVIADRDRYWETTAFAGDSRVIVAAGGRERYHSVLNGLAKLTALVAPQQWVLVHDVARPCLCLADIDALIGAIAGDADGYLLGAPVRDTMKQTDGSGRVMATAERAGLWHAFTPQLFRLGQLQGALSDCLAKGVLVTDEASAMELCGFHPQMVAGSEQNIKITRPSDLPLAEWILKTQRQELV